MKQIILVVTVGILSACSTVPLTNRKQFTAIPTAQMLTLSNQSYSQVLQEENSIRNTNESQAIARVGRRIANAVEVYLASIDRKALIDGYEWEFNLIKSDALNAWCMPGGKIAFYTGILPICQNDNGIAVVMAHEVAHAIAKHGNERMSQQLVLQMGGTALSEALKESKETTMQIAMTAFGLGAQLGVTLPYSRKHESEADELGLYFMAMANYDPREAPEFWIRMMSQSEGNPPEFLSTHPNPQKRINNLKRLMPKAMEYYRN
ncbi:M48 family metallopeptidase [uncultured Sunxiuqinia sp.]|uniref:M48 family metallopeptidase n=1 Tax=uncultured Sunxiuqinia sp. TaxID=1573825 RepID=UPI002AA88532|nr:M48 family metallopeptidase [uncultured Sunxiuqinia sp.]